MKIESCLGSKKISEEFAEVNKTTHTSNKSNQSTKSYDRKKRLNQIARIMS